MAIKPPSDLVLDVARAADPIELRESVEKLRNAKSAVRSANAKLNVNGFAELATSSKVADTKEASVSKASFAAPIQQLTFNSEDTTSQNTTAYKKFEAFMLQNFIENMFTTETPSVFGEGLAGDVWKSMMVEQIASEMAKGGGIGVAKMLENNQYKRQENTNNSFDARQSAITAFAGDGSNRQAKIDNIVHSNERNLVRQFKS